MTERFDPSRNALASDSSAFGLLNERSREIFRHIVDSYLTYGGPVGSRQLSRLLPMSLSPASVRNVMQDLEELGLIYARHISAVVCRQSAVCDFSSMLCSKSAISGRTNARRSKRKCEPRPRNMRSTLC